MEEQTHKHIHLNENPDSIELGTPAKGGAIKIYVDFSKEEEAKDKIKNAIELRMWANKLLISEE